MNSLVKYICVAAILPFLFFLQGADAEPVHSEERSQYNLPENGIIIAAFFPGNSTFSHSRIKNTVNRKRNKNKKIKKKNRIKFNKFIEREILLFDAFEKRAKGKITLLYWQLGEAISREEQEQIKQKKYYPFLIQSIALTVNLPEQAIEKTKIFYKTYPVIAFVPGNLTWEHIDPLLDITDESVRLFYQNHIVENNVTPDELKVLITSKVHETTEHEK